MSLFELLRRLTNPPETISDYRSASLCGSQVPPVNTPAPPAPPPEVPKRYPEAERIATSLRDYPGDWGWRHKGYELEHKPSGFVLWVANKSRGLAERANGCNSELTTSEQAIVWPAVEAWLDSHRVGFTGRLPKVKIWRKGGIWRCMSDQHPWAGAGSSPDEAYRSWSRAISIEARTDQRPGEILHVWSAAQ
ncbi:hypothetical protein [Pseudomonas putida]|uniref:Uncharacterized protein n=1 Tax=Pseudomonas putida TaxID=303 RepID=A0A6S5TQT8_PSEPU|nr:hypothetical protein [Pseudomonas putida]BBT39064.1 hypothetical protein WP8W18C01_14050 [Pseudomonas putida]